MDGEKGIASHILYQLLNEAEAEAYSEEKLLQRGYEAIHEQDGAILLCLKNPQR